MILACSTFIPGMQERYGFLMYLNMVKGDTFPAFNGKITGTPFE